MTNPSDTFHTFYSREYLSGPTLMIRELEFLAASEHVHMETGFFGCPNTLIVANSTLDEYSETFVDVPTAQVYPSRDHAQAGVIS